MKKFWKKTMALLLCIVMLMSIMAVNVFAVRAIAGGALDEDMMWLLTDDGTLTISGEGKMKDYSATTAAPWFANRLAVRKIVIEDGITRIGACAFEECINAESVEIPDSVTEIRYDAFAYCESLTEVSLPDSIENIGESAFAGCSKLSNIGIAENNVNYVKDEYGVLYSRDMTMLRQAPGTLSGEYTIPPTVSVICSDAFNGCKELTSVIIPESVGGISLGAFRGSGITSIVIPDSVSDVDNLAFMDCKDLTSVTLSKNIRTIGYRSFMGCSSLTSIVIPDGVTWIDDEAFKGCTSLTDVTVPDTVTRMFDEVFMDCASLKSITIPASVTEIGDGAFEGCTSLTAFSVAAENPNYSSDEKGVLFNKDKSELLKVPGGMTGAYTIPENVSIDLYAFEGCNSITSIIIPESMTAIPMGLFYDCSGLTNITLHDNFKSIGNFAFRGCTSLKTITIPASVTNIGAYAFDGCANLDGIWVDAENTRYSNDENGVLYNKNKTALYHVPGTMTGTLTLAENVMIMDDHAFYGCAALEGVVVDEDNPYYFTDENGALYFEDEEDEEASTVLLFVPRTLEGSYTVSQNVETIGTGAFANCTELTEIVLPENLIGIRDYAFDNCTGLTNITIPAKVYLMMIDVFSGCTELNEIKFTGSMPSGISSNILRGITATAYYPANNYTWNYTAMKTFGDDITWKAYTPDDSVVPVIPQTGIKGDVNDDGYLTNSDIITVARHIVGLVDSETIEGMLIELKGDANMDGELTNSDLIMIARIIVEWEGVG